METMSHVSRQVNTNAEKTYLTWNGRNMTKNEFSQLPLTIIFFYEDTILGYTYYPRSDLTDKNKYIVIEREGKLVVAPCKHRPVRHDYRDAAYWDKLIPNIWSSKQVHQHQFHMWNKVMSSEMKQLFLSSRVAYN